MTDYKAVLALRPMPCRCRASHFSYESSVFCRLILRGVGVRRFLFLRRVYERHKTQDGPSK
nr:MAG TPA: hypothetical protein [Caudoviricetes sp.]